MTDLFKKFMIIGVIVIFLGSGVYPCLANSIKLESKEIKEKVAISSTKEEKSFYPSDDTRIYYFFPDENYCESHTITITNRCGHPNDGCIFEHDGLIKFNLSEIYGTKVTSAKLKLYYYDWWDNDPAGRKISLIRITSDWEECQATWNNQPTYDGETCYSNVPNSIKQWQEWNVTSDVQKFVKQEISNYGWKITDPVDWNDKDIPTAYYYTSNYEDEQYHPQLIINYEISRTKDYYQPIFNIIKHLSQCFPLLAYLLQLPIFNKILN